MATAAKAGRIAFVAMGASTSSMAEIGEVRNWRVTVTHRPIDATSNDSSGWDESIKGQQAWTMTGESFNLATEAEQNTMRKMFSTSGTKYFQLRPSTSLTQKWVGPGWMTNGEVGGSHDQAQIFNWSVQGTGPVTYST